jgi:RNA polymerase sigma-70 factor, ECF subfamily
MIFPPGQRHMGMSNDEVGAVIAAAQAGDQAAFATLVERHRRELQVHCYRMLGSLEDAEDQVQETFLRAWRKRASFKGRSTFRAWLYRIATNACLDLLAKRPRNLAPRGEGLPGPSEVVWLQPYPDELLEGIPSREEAPDAAVVSRETIELAFLVAIQHLPPRQRAVLLLRDLLGWSAKDTAALLETSVASANSALQRARATLKRRLPARRLDWGPTTAPSAEERAVLQRYMDAHERGDPSVVIALLRDDARLSISPGGWLWQGREAIGEALLEGMTRPGEWRMVATRANRQPAAAGYLRRPGDSTYRAHVVCVLRVRGGALEDIAAFEEPRLFPAFGLPPSL